MTHKSGVRGSASNSCVEPFIFSFSVIELSATDLGFMNGVKKISSARQGALSQHLIDREVIRSAPPKPVEMAVGLRSWTNEKSIRESDAVSVDPCTE